MQKDATEHGKQQTKDIVSSSKYYEGKKKMSQTSCFSLGKSKKKKKQTPFRIRSDLWYLQMKPKHSGESSTLGRK